MIDKIRMCHSGKIHLFDDDAIIIFNSFYRNITQYCSLLIEEKMKTMLFYFVCIDFTEFNLKHVHTMEIMFVSY